MIQNLFLTKQRVTYPYCHQYCVWQQIIIIIAIIVQHIHFGQNWYAIAMRNEISDGWNGCTFPQQDYDYKIIYFINLAVNQLHMPTMGNLIYACCQVAHVDEPV